MYEAPLPAELIDDTKNLAPGKLRQPGEQTLERARSFLNQVHSNRRLCGHCIHRGSFLSHRFFDHLVGCRADGENFKHKTGVTYSGERMVALSMRP